MTNIEPLVQALLYEGYILYPYRSTALKNQHRWTFGGLVPRAYSVASDNCEKWFFQTECLVMADVGATLNVSVRFLHPVLWSEHESSPRQEATE